MKTEKRTFWKSPDFGFPKNANNFFYSLSTSSWAGLFAGTFGLSLSFISSDISNLSSFQARKTYKYIRGILTMFPMLDDLQIFTACVRYLLLKSSQVLDLSVESEKYGKSKTKKVWAKISRKRGPISKKWRIRVVVF